MPSNRAMRKGLLGAWAGRKTARMPSVGVMAAVITAGSVPPAVGPVDTAPIDPASVDVASVDTGARGSAACCSSIGRG